MLRYSIRSRVDGYKMVVPRSHVSKTCVWRLRVPISTRYKGMLGKAEESLKYVNAVETKVFSSAYVWPKSERVIRERCLKDDEFIRIKKATLRQLIAYLEETGVMLYICSVCKNVKLRYGRV